MNNLSYYTYNTGKSPEIFLKNALEASVWIQASTHEWAWTQEQREDMAAAVQYLHSQLKAKEEENERLRKIISGMRPFVLTIEEAESSETLFCMSSEERDEALSHSSND